MGMWLEKGVMAVSDVNQPSNNQSSNNQPSDPDALSATVSFSDAVLQDDAQALAARLELPLNLPDATYVLELTPSGLVLHTPQDTLTVDFANRDMQKRIAGGKSQDLAKAVGVGRGQVPYPHVLDATAGVGRDAFVLASLGCKVHMLERHPLLAALLTDALTRAQSNPDIQVASQYLSLEARDALDVLTEDNPYDVIYLDPMYPETNKKALPKKNMQVLRGLLGSDDASGLLEHALATNVPRIVIKRPKHAPKTPAPSVSITGKQTRFDVYVR